MCQLADLKQHQDRAVVRKSVERACADDLAIASVLVSAPEKWWREVGARHLLANKAPELAYLRLDLRALPANDLEDEAGIVR